MRSLRWMLVVVALLLSAQAQAAKKQYVCVFDPVGRDGDIFSIAKDVATEFLTLGVDLKLYPYTTEASAVQDLKAGLCDAAILLASKSANLISFLQPSKRLVRLKTMTLCVSYCRH